MVRYNQVKGIKKSRLLPTKVNTDFS